MNSIMLMPVETVTRWEVHGPK